MKIYGSFTSPYVRHCRIAVAQACEEIKLEFEFIETDNTASAKLSPTQKVPYLIDGDLSLSDSSSILKYLREKSGRAFIADIHDFDLFCMVNTMLDATMNVFFLERFDGIQAADSQYLGRQQKRVESALAEINSQSLPATLPLGDAHIRLACFLDWALFRNRITLAGHANLSTFLELARSWPVFACTAPPSNA